MLASSIVAILVGFALLVWSADRFVYGAAAVANNFGVSTMIIGITIVGFGTSAPEMLISAFAAIDGNPGLAIGNAIGSNIANITLILGVTALIIPLSVHSRTLQHEFPLLMGVMFFAWWLMRDGTLGRSDGILLGIALFAVMGWLIFDAMRARPDDPMREELEDEIPHEVPTGKAALWLILGLAVLLVSSKMLVWGAVNVAHMYGVSDLVIGLTIVAIGTSLPELAASVMSALKDEADLAVGNVIGSNIFNTLGVLAIPALITPSQLKPETLTRDLPIMLGVTALLFLMAFGFKSPDRRINRYEGAILLACFIGYMSMIYMSLISK
jgi:cation:H+ antiporter